MKDLSFIRLAPDMIMPVSAIENDLLPDGQGDFQVVSGHDYVIQNVVKILLTARGSDPILPTYGSDMSKAVGQRDIDQTETISQSIKKALSFLIQVETSRIPSERIKAIKSLTVTGTSVKVATLSLVLEDGQVLTVQRKI